MRVLTLVFLVVFSFNLFANELCEKAESIMIESWWCEKDVCTVFVQGGNKWSMYFVIQGDSLYIERRSFSLGSGTYTYRTPAYKNRCFAELKNRIAFTKIIEVLEQ
jgi:hypothetical protein